MKLFQNYGVIALLMIIVFSVAGYFFSEGYSAATVFVEEKTGNQPLVIIDAGHGGEDGGAMSGDGTPESQYNLVISQRLDCLLGLLGCRTGMIRTEDTSLADADAQGYSAKKVSDLKNRVSLINEQTDAIVISIHQNHFSEPQYRGAQVFYRNCEQSQHLAAITQENLRTALDMTNTRQIKPAEGIFLMEQICHPGILVECGFLSNPEEAKLLQTPEYQNQIAIAIASSLFSYLGENLI